MAGPVTGQKGAWRQPSEWGRNESGNYQVWVFEGTRGEVKALAGNFANVQGLSYAVRESFGKWRLEVQFPWNADGLVDPRTDTIERWELFSQHAEKDMLEAQDQGGVIGTLSTGQKEKIRNKILQPPQDGNTSQADFVTVPASGNPANAFTVYTLMNAGMRSYLMMAPALRRTIITSNQWAVGYALFNVRRLMSTMYLPAHENLPSSLLFNIVNYTAGDVAADPNLAYGWYKFFPTINQVALLKWQIVQEFQYGWWPTALYGAVLQP